MHFNETEVGAKKKKKKIFTEDSKKLEMKSIQVLSWVQFQRKEEGIVQYVWPLQYFVFTEINGIIDEDIHNGIIRFSTWISQIRLKIHF